MSRYHKYDPDSMFPRKPKTRCATKGKVMRWIIIVLLAAFAIWVGAGCKSLPNVKELDFSITGLELEFYPSHPDQEKPGFFGNFQYITNRMERAPMPVVYPLLMNRNGDIK